MKRSRLVGLWCVGSMSLSAFLLSGCGQDDPQPRFAAQTTPAVGESASPAPSESVVPDDETPEEFIRRWNKLDHAMHNTGETEDFSAVSSKCEPCMDVADRVAAYYAAGGSVEWAGREITGIQRLGRGAFDVRFESAPVRVKKSADQAAERLEGGPGRMRFVLEKRDGFFRMTHLAALPL